MDPTRLIPYSPEVLDAVVRFYNETVFPAQIAAGALALIALVALRLQTRWSGRAAAAILCLFWLWCAVLWHVVQYAAINWAGTWYAVFFAVQAALLIGFGLLADGLAPAAAGNRVWTGGVVAALALAAGPLTALAAGKNIGTAGYVGTGPDATAVFTLALLALARRPRIWLLLIPGLWLLLSLVWTFLLGAPERAVLPVIGLLAVVLLILPGRRRRT